MYDIVKLSNGLRVVLCNIPYVKSVSLGIWIKAGSVYETPANNGISHLIEHMIFKGTSSRDCQTIAEQIDEIGGGVNAFTSKDCTCYYIKVLSEDVPEAVDLLSDLLLNSVFDDADMKMEKNVVLEEISMNNDMPDELVYDTLHQTVWKNHPLGMQILGTEQTVSNITRADIEQYMSRYYVAENAVISVVGNFDRQRLIELLEQKFSVMKSGSAPNAADAAHKPPFATEEVTLYKDIEQTHLLLGYESFAHNDARRYALYVVNRILGGSMSSRLFQNIRERKGMVYNINSSFFSYETSGIAVIYAGVSPQNKHEVINLIQAEIDEVQKNGITERELNQSKRQIKRELMLGLESTSARMSSYGQSLLIKGSIDSDDEKLERINRLDLSATHQVIQQVYSATPAACFVQPNV